MTKEQLAIESLKLLKDWSIWMVTVQTALLGFLGALPKLSIVVNKTLLRLTVALFTISILLAAWVLSSIPSVVRRIDNCFNYVDAKLYDINWLPAWLTLNCVAIFQHLAFAIGMIFFAIGIYQSFKPLHNQ